MTIPFFTATFAASRADALIGQIKIGLGQAPVGANMALIFADEACGQALIDRLVDWLKQELGSTAVLALPLMGREGDQAQIQLLIGQADATGFGPLNDWSFDALDQGLPEMAAGLLSLDPRMPFIPQRLQLLNEAGGGYLIGGVSAPSGSYRGAAGLGFALGTPLISEIFHGVERLDQEWTITAAQGQVIHEINKRPALEVLCQVAGDILARKIDQIPKFIFTAFPVSSASPTDFLVRRINGLGRHSGSFSVEDEVLPGMPLAFAKRNGPYMHSTLRAGLSATLSRAGIRPRGAIYLYDHRRAVDFSDTMGEGVLVRQILDPVPLICGAVQGVISHNRLYTLASQLILIL